MSKLSIRKVKTLENPLLYRKEYVLAIIHDASSTPSRDTLREEISKQLGVNKDLVVVRKIKTDFGTNVAKVEVHVYDSREKMLEIEPEYILRRNKIIESKK